MLFAINCPNCRHRGYVAEAKLLREIQCSRCGFRARPEPNADQRLIISRRSDDHELGHDEAPRR
jgi:DNA-directed RNA polymerase subunit RPC12/RpoP